MYQAAQAVDDGRIRHRLRSIEIGVQLRTGAAEIKDGAAETAIDGDGQRNGSAWVEEKNGKRKGKNKIQIKLRAYGYS